MTGGAPCVKLLRPRAARSSTPAGATARRRARRRRPDRRGRAPTCDADAGRGARLRRAASSPRASSTCTSTCASRAARRPRRSRPARGPPPSAATPPSCAMPNTDPAIDSPAVVREVLDLGRDGGLCDVFPVGAHHRRPRRRASWRRLGEMAALGVRDASPTTAAGVQDARLMRRALEYAPGLRRHARPALRGRRARRRRPHARGRVVEPCSASPAGRPRPRS